MCASERFKKDTNSRTWCQLSDQWVFTTLNLNRGYSYNPLFCWAPTVRHSVFLHYLTQWYTHILHSPSASTKLELVQGVYELGIIVLLLLLVTWHFEQLYAENCVSSVTNNKQSYRAQFVRANTAPKKAQTWPAARAQFVFPRTVHYSNSVRILAVPSSPLQP